MSGGGIAPPSATTPEPAVIGDAGKNPSSHRISLSPRHFYVLGVAIVLSAAGMVSFEDLAFFLFSLIYMYFLSKVAFPPTSPHPEPNVFGEQNTTLGYYVFSAAVIGLYLPIAYILESVYYGDRERAMAAAPHLFLLCMQIFCEGIAFSCNFSLAIRVFVPVFYNSRRIFSIIDWLRSEFLEEGYGGNGRRVKFGRAIAVANMGLWSFNLFGFLLPFFLPKAFKIYYSKQLKIKD